MEYHLGQASLTGIDRLDAEHRELIEQVNAVAGFEKSRDMSGVLGALAHLMADLADHFHQEELRLSASNYPNLDAHIAHHSQSLCCTGSLYWRYTRRAAEWRGRRIPLLSRNSLDYSEGRHRVHKLARRPSDPRKQMMGAPSHNADTLIKHFNGAFSITEAQLEEAPLERAFLEGPE